MANHIVLKIMIELNMQMRLEIDFLNHQQMLEWDGIKIWNEQTIEAFIHYEQSYLGQHNEVPVQVELNEEKNLYIVDKTQP